MPPATRDRPVAFASLSESVEVETPELVVLSYTIAGPGSRVYAALIDLMILLGVKLVVFLGLLTITATGAVGRSSAWAAAMILILFVGVDWAYYVLFEALMDGQTPGKRALRLRVVRDGGYSVTFGASAVRNLFRVIDMQPGVFYGVGMTSAIISRLGKRLGDMAAGTLVVREDTARADAPAVAVAAPAGEPVQLHTHLSDAEFGVLERFVQRSGDLDADRRAAFGTQLASRFAAALKAVDEAAPAEGSDRVTTAGRLARLHASERAARARGVAHRSDTGAARERHAIVARGSARWATFAARLDAARRGGIAAMTETEARDFVREYRELTADLARLRTAARGREAGEIFYLNRLAAGAHNLLYRRRTIALAEVVGFIFVAVPREIRASAGAVFLAAALLFGPMMIAYTAVVRDPALAEQLVPPAMIERAEDGVRRAKTGDGYIDDPQIFRPMMASAVIANNVQVSIGAFAGGITGGLLTALILFTNGVSIGSFFGLYASKDIGTLLLAFVAPHGVLELTAICIAGGAGFLMAAAVLIPGARTRRAALAENGRRAIRLVTGATLLLLVAGVIEGMISPIPWWPLAGKLAVSGATAAALYVYLRLGVLRAPLVP